MAITIAPLLSFGASGTIAKSVTYSKWKGITYARQRVIPANPKTTAQMNQRAAFQWVHDAFKNLPADVSSMWAQLAKGQKFTAANGWMTANLPVLKAAVNQNNIVWTKPTRGGPVPAAATFTGGANKVTVAATAPTLQTGWAITKMVGVATPQEDPHGEHEGMIFKYVEDTTTPYSADITGLITGTVYVTGAFFIYTDEIGKTQYGGAINGTATAT